MNVIEGLILEAKILETDASWFPTFFRLTATIDAVLVRGEWIYIMPGSLTPSSVSNGARSASWITVNLAMGRGLPVFQVRIAAEDVLAVRRPLP